jgi:WD40 repeat protein
VLGAVEIPRGTGFDVDHRGDWIATVTDNTLILRPMDDLAQVFEPSIDVHDAELLNVDFSRNSDHLIVNDSSGRYSVWSWDGDSLGFVRVLDPVDPRLTALPRFGPSGRWVAVLSTTEREVNLWDLEGSPDAGPVTLRRRDNDAMADVEFDPTGRWLATANASDISWWVLGGPMVRVLSRGSDDVTTMRLSVTSDGRWLTSSGYGEERLWPLGPGLGAVPLIDPVFDFVLQAHPSRSEVIAAGWRGPVSIVPLDGGPPRQILGKVGGVPSAIAVDGEGRRVAVGTGFAEDAQDLLLRIVDLETGDVQVIPTVDREAKLGHFTGGIRHPRFAPDGTLFTGGFGGVRQWNLETGTSSVLYEAELAYIDMTPDGRHLVAVGGREGPSVVAPPTELRVFDLEEDTSRVITSHGDPVALALDPTGRIIVTGDTDGVVRVGSLSGEEPHLLIGHEGRIFSVVISPDGRWVFSVSGSEIRQWSMPDLSKPPLHTLPREELIAKLKTLTNIRVVPDEQSSTGWKLETGPFPGWGEFPEW